MEQSAWPHDRYVQKTKSLLVAVQWWIVATNDNVDKRMFGSADLCKRKRSEAASGRQPSSTLMAGTSLSRLTWQLKAVSGCKCVHTTIQSAMCSDQQVMPSTQPL